MDSKAHSWSNYYAHCIITSTKPQKTGKTSAMNFSSTWPAATLIHLHHYNAGHQKHGIRPYAKAAGLGRLHAHTHTVSTLAWVYSYLGWCLAAAARVLDINLTSDFIYSLWLQIWFHLLTLTLPQCPLKKKQVLSDLTLRRATWSSDARGLI